MQGVDLRPLECIGGPLHGFLHIGGPFTVQEATDAHVAELPLDAPWAHTPHSVMYSMYAGEYMSCVSPKEAYTYLFQSHNWGGKRHLSEKWECLDLLDRLCVERLRTPLYFDYGGPLWERRDCRVALAMPAVTLFTSISHEASDYHMHQRCAAMKWAREAFDQWMGILSSVWGSGMYTLTGERSKPISEGALMLPYRGCGSLQIQRFGHR